MAENEVLDLKHGPLWARLRRLIKADAHYNEIVDVFLESFASEMKRLDSNGVSLRTLINDLNGLSSDAERSALLRRYRFARESAQKLIYLSTHISNSIQLEIAFWKDCANRVFQQERVLAARESSFEGFPAYDTKAKRVLSGVESKLRNLLGIKPSQRSRKYRQIVASSPRNQPEVLVNESLLGLLR